MSFPLQYPITQQRGQHEVGTYLSSLIMLMSVQFPFSLALFLPLFFIPATVAVGVLLSDQFLAPSSKQQNDLLTSGMVCTDVARGSGGGSLYISHCSVQLISSTPRDSTMSFLLFFRCYEKIRMLQASGFTLNRTVLYLLCVGQGVP